MAATTTFAALLSALAEELDLGLVIDAGTGSTTTITEADTGVSELRGTFTGLRIPVGSPVSVITGGTVGEDSYVSNWVPGTGVVTLSPAVTTGATGFIIWKPEVKHAKNIEKAVSRAHQKCRRWMKVPLTYVPDGDLLGGTVTDFWTASAGTASYVSLAYPEMAGQRALQISHTSTANVQSNIIPVRAGEPWRFHVPIRVTTGTGATDAADITVVDVTNTASIDMTFTTDPRGLYGTSYDRGFEMVEGTFTVPATCSRIRFKLTVSGSSNPMTAQMGPLIAFPTSARQFPLQQRVLNVEERVGNFYYSCGGDGPEELAFTEPITTSGRTHSFADQGDHYVVTFNFTPTEPVYYDELIYGGALTAMTDTTQFPAEYVRKRARAEIYDWLMRQEMTSGTRLENGQPAPSVYRSLRNAAVKEAKWSSQEPELQNIVGRR